MFLCVEDSGGHVKMGERWFNFPLPQGFHSPQVGKLQKNLEARELQSFKSSHFLFPNDGSEVSFDDLQQPVAEPQSGIELEGRVPSSTSSLEALLLKSDKPSVSPSQLLHTITSTQKLSERPLRYGFKTRSESDILDDGYKWRKYGKKFRKSNQNPSNYYRCSHSDCGVRKRVERDAEDKNIVITTYEGKHNHERPSSVSYIGNHPMFLAQQAALGHKVINWADLPRGESSTQTSQSDRSVQPPQRMAMDRSPYASASEDVMVDNLTIVRSAASSDLLSQLIDQILNPKADKPDFDLGQLVAQIDALLVDYDTQLRKTNTFHQKSADLPSASEASNFTNQVSKHVKLIANQIRLYPGDKHHTSIRVLNAIGNIHWAAVGFLVLGAALEDVDTINNNKEEFLRLFMSMNDLSKVILQFQDLPGLKMELHSKLKESIHLIVIGAILSDLEKQSKGFERMFKASTDGQELQQLSRDIDDMYNTLILHISTPTLKGVLSGAYQHKKPTSVHPAMDALGELPKISALHKRSLCSLETTFPRKLLKCSPSNNKIHPGRGPWLNWLKHSIAGKRSRGPIPPPMWYRRACHGPIPPSTWYRRTYRASIASHVKKFTRCTADRGLSRFLQSKRKKIHPPLSHHRMAELQRMDDVKRIFQRRLELFRFSYFPFADFNLNRVELEISRLRWLVRLDFSGSNLLDNHLSGSELRFEASNLTPHPLNALPQHLKNLPSLQYLDLESTFRLSSSVIDQIPNTKSTTNSVRDKIIDLNGITMLDVEQNLNEKRYNSSVVEQISNQKKASSSVVEQISNKNKTSSSEVNLITDIKRDGNSVIELQEMIDSNFSWSMDSSQEVLNLQNTLFLPQQIGDLLEMSNQNLQSTFHLPQIGDLSKLKVINLQNLICLRQRIKDLLPLKVLKLQISLYLPQHSRDLSTLKVLNLQKTLLDTSPSSLGKLENLHPIVCNKCDKLLELPEGGAFVEYKPQSKKVSVQREKYRIFLICYDWDGIKALVDKLVKSLKVGGVKVIVIELLHWEMTDKKCFSLKQVSEGTNIHIPILSKKHYLWHLEQWLCICRPNSIIRPLFYDANEDIKYRYDKALNKLSNTQDSTAGVFSSLDAPLQASFLSGWSSLDYRTDWQLVKRVVFDILEMLNNQPLHLPLRAVGLEERMEDLTDKLEMELDRLKMVVAICGMGGIGKTTLAKAIFNSIGPMFQACSFVASVKGKELCELQEQILKDLSRQDFIVKSVEHGKALMKAHLGSIKALVILDDIDHSMQLEALSVDWLAPGSRLLLIFRDIELLAFAHADKIYEMDLLEFEQSLELFSWHAFLRTNPDDGYEDRSQKIAEACQGIPLLLEVAGASLYGRTETRYWHESIKHLESSIDKDIHRRLCVSTQVLTYHEIEIFLDIACFFVGKENLDTASRFWEAIGHTPNRALEKLIQNSLVMINDKNQFIMHDLLQDMGRAMIADKSPDVGKRSRLWKPDDALQVITEGLGTMSVQGISISKAERSNIVLKAESFAPMTNLQLLWIAGENVKGDFLNLCPGLRWLRWNSCPLRCLPSEWSVKHLTVLDLSSEIRGSPSELREFWSERSLYKEFKNLNVLRLSSAQYLEKLPDFSIFPALMVLDLEDCANLRNIPDSIGILEGLKSLNLSWCRNLVELPCGISKLSSLEKLSLSHCFSLKKLPRAMEELIALKELDIGFSRHIENLPSFGKLINLEKLILAGCLSIRSLLPNSIGELNNLKELDIQFLGLIQEVPSLGKLSCLKKLILSGCESLRNIPTSIGELRCLQYLEMNKCSSIDCLPEKFGDLVQLEELYMNDCPRLLKLPSSFGNLGSLKILELRHNPNLMQLPSSFSKLPSLVWFDASDCNLLDGLHEEIGALLPLGILNLENNFFCQLPPSICKLTNLTKLNLNNCQSLEELPILPQGIVELDVGNCTQLIRLPSMSYLKRLTVLILCNCENLIRLPELSSCQCLVVLNISRCINIISLSGVEGLKSLETLYFGGSGVSVLELNQHIKDMPQLKEVCIHANEVPRCLELKTGDHYLNDDNVTDILNYSVENNTKCGGIFLFFVVNFMHEYYTPGSPSRNFVELAIIADDQEAIWVTVFSNRQNVDGDQLYICMYGETHLLVRRMEAANSISVRAKGRNIQVRECGMQLLYNGIGDANFERFVEDLSVLVESYTPKTSKDEVDAIEDDIPYKTRDEVEPDGDLYDYGYATSEGEYQTDEDLARCQ